MSTRGEGVSGFEWFLVIVVVILVPLAIAVAVTLWTLEMARQRNKRNRGAGAVGTKRRAVRSTVPDETESQSAATQKGPGGEVST